MARAQARAIFGFTLAADERIPGAVSPPKTQASYVAGFHDNADTPGLARWAFTLALADLFGGAEVT